MAGRHGGCATEEDETQHHAGADRSVVPAEAGGDDLRLADRAGLRASELDLVARVTPRLRPHNLDLVAGRERVVVRHRAGHAVVGGDDVAARRARERAYDFDLVAAELSVVARQRAGHAVVAGAELHLRAGRDATLVDLRLRHRRDEGCNGESESDPLDEPIPSPIAAHLPCSFRLTPATGHQTVGGPLFFHEQAVRVSRAVKQIYPATITGKSFAPGGSVLDHNFGRGDPYTLGVEEEYMLLDGQSFDLVQHVDTVLTAVSNGELTDRIGPE